MRRESPARVLPAARTMGTTIGPRRNSRQLDVFDLVVGALLLKVDGGARTRNGHGGIVDIGFAVAEFLETVGRADDLDVDVEVVAVGHVRGDRFHGGGTGGLDRVFAGGVGRGTTGCEYGDCRQDGCGEGLARLNHGAWPPASRRGTREADGRGSSRSPWSWSSTVRSARRAQLAGRA